MNAIKQITLSFFFGICIFFQIKAQCPPPVSLSFTTSSTTSTCEANGTITINAQDGELPYSYQITAGPAIYPIQSSNIFPALPNGTYTVEVSDGCGAILSDSVQVAGDYQIPSFSVNTKNPFCPADMNGSITGIATNGLAPYEFKLINVTTTPDTIGPQPTGVFTGLESGDYRIQVFDQCNNFQTRDISLQDPTLNSFEAIFYASTSYNQTTCGNLFVRASANVLDEKYPHTYALKDNTGMVIHSGLIYRKDTVFGVPNYGNYTYCLSDACGRTDTQSASIYARAFPTYGFNCDPFGVRINVDFMIGPYTYEILSGPEIRPLQTNNFFPNLMPGVYVIRVVDSCGSIVFANVDVDPIDWEVGVYSRPADACAIGMSRFWPASGGVGAPQYPLTYELISAPPGVPLVSTTGHPASLLDLPPGNYQIRVTDDCGVSKTIPGLITGTLSLNYTVSTETGCQTGDILVNGSYSNASGGKVRLENLDGSIARGFNVPISPFYNVIPDTFVLAFNSNEPGCTSTFFRDTIILPQASQPELDLLTGIECVDLSATITGFPLGGVPAYTFEIISGPELRAPQSTPIFSGLPFGTYDVRMVDDCSNSFVNSVSIEPFLPVLNGYTPPVCMGESLNLYVDNIYGANYSWTGPNGFTADTFLVNIASLSPQDTGTYTVNIDLPGCASTELEFDLIAARCGVIVDIHLLLQGPYKPATSLMTDNLRSSQLLPSMEPYSGLGYSHFGEGGGEVILPGVFDVSGPNGIVDWVFLELRDAADFSQIIATRSALLQADGDVVDVDGSSYVYFEGVDDANYYVVARHRNHLDIMTPGSLPLTEAVAYRHDFATGSAYGSLSYPVQKSLGSGLFALYESDFDNSGSIDAADRSIAWNFRNQMGYLSEDSNFDGYCDAAERSQCWNNRNLLSQIP